jgi:hypothetical protein
MERRGSPLEALEVSKADAPPIIIRDGEQKRRVLAGNTAPMKAVSNPRSL